MPIAIPAIAAVLIGLLAMLVYYGADKLGKVIISWTPDIHIPGLPGLKSLVRDVVEAGVDLVRSIMYPAVHPVLKFIHGVVIWITDLIGAIVETAPAVAGALYRLAHTWIPAHLAALRDWVMGHILHLAAAVALDFAHTRLWVLDHLDGIRAWAAAHIAAAVAVVAAAVNDLRVNVWAGIDAARALTHTLVGALAAATAAEFDHVRGWVSQRILGVEHDLAVAVHGVEADIASAVTFTEAFATHAAAAAATSVLDLTTDVGGVVAQTWDGLISDDIPALEAVLGTDFPDIRVALGALIGTEAIPLVGSLADSLVMSRVLSRYLRECGIPNCRNLGGLGRFIQDLLGVEALAGLLEMLLAIVHDPENAAAEAAAEVGDLMGGARTLARDLLGVG